MHALVISVITVYEPAVGTGISKEIEVLGLYDPAGISWSELLEKSLGPLTVIVTGMVSGNITPFGKVNVTCMIPEFLHLAARAPQQLPKKRIDNFQSLPQ